MIADQSVNHVERFIIDEGHTAQRLEKDYGYDLLLFTFDEQGYTEPGLASLQLKAGETLEAVGSDFVYDLDVRDYNLWMLEEFPVLFVLFDASRRRAFWPRCASLLPRRCGSPTEERRQDRAAGVPGPPDREPASDQEMARSQRRSDPLAEEKNHEEH